MQDIASRIRFPVSILWNGASIHIEQSVSFQDILVHKKQDGATIPIYTGDDDRSSFGGASSGMSQRKLSELAAFLFFRNLENSDATLGGKRLYFQVQFNESESVTCSVKWLTDWIGECCEFSGTNQASRELGLKEQDVRDKVIKLAKQYQHEADLEADDDLRSRLERVAMRLKNAPGVMLRGDKFGQLMNLDFSELLLDRNVE